MGAWTLLAPSRGKATLWNSDPGPNQSRRKSRSGSDHVGSQVSSPIEMVYPWTRTRYYRVISYGFITVRRCASDLVSSGQDSSSTNSSHLDGYSQNVLGLGVSERSLFTVSYTGGRGHRRYRISFLSPCTDRSGLNDSGPAGVAFV
jgi:hypothetical protein